MSKKAKPEEPAGESAPMWIVSFADLVTLMMSFFVVLYALKQGGPEQQLETAAAIKAQFGYRPPDDSTDPLDLAVASMISGRYRPPTDNHLGHAQVEAKGAEGRHAEVETIYEGKQITTGGLLSFDAGSAVLTPNAEKKLAEIADRLRGKPNILLVKGHVSADELSLRPDDPAGLDLSYRRALAVIAALVKLDIDPRGLRPVPCGANEPMKTQAYDPASQQINRRAEIFSTDRTVSDFTPTTLVPAATRSSKEPEPH